ncbi:MAG: radical SAM protein [Candidatus Daviesbacteria bacterium]|nr:radical SAM protein [Candidatus Daviesbacteria bacterium]
MDIAFNVTRKCNKGCDYCYLSLTGEELSFDKIREILESVDVETVTLTGGEPLMHPDIKELLSFLSQRGNHIHLLSNGILLTEDYLPAISEANAELFVTYNDSNKKISGNLHEANQRGIDVNLHHVLTERSVASLDDVCQNINFAKSLLLLYPTDLGQEIVNMYDPEKWFPLLDRAISITQLHGIKTYFEQAFAKKGLDLAKQQPCPTGKDLFIDANGMSYPCCLLVDKVQGNERLVPVRMNPKKCNFIRDNPLPDSSDYIRICPIVITDRYDGSFQFPSHLGEKK